jgi:hypothetical protein
MPTRADRVHPHQALAVYAEPLAAGRRVVVLGDADTGLAERLEELGAAVVVVLSPDEDLDEVRAARFDLAVVADLARFADPAAILARVRRMVGESGAAVVAASNRDAGDADASGSLDYYALFDLVAREFAEVRMVAQLAFHGVALAEVGDEDETPAVSVDTQLADPDRVPQAFVAVASQRGTSLDPYAIVELPAGDVTAADDGELEATRGELEETRGRLDAARGQLEEARFQVQALATQLDALEARAARAGELERELAERGRQLADLSTQAEAIRSAAEAGAIAATQVEALALRAERAERHAETLSTRADRAELALATSQPDLEHAAERHAVELVRFEEALRERAQAVRALESEVARRERLVRELVATLEEQTHATSPPAHPPTNGAADSTMLTALADDNARLQKKLDALALELARREADAQSTAWTVQELERKLGAAPASSAQPPPPPTASTPTASGVLDELDALRRALTQEHDARVRAESGEELVRARAEIQRQSALLAQLGQPAAGVDELR